MVSLQRAQAPRPPKIWYAVLLVLPLLLPARIECFWGRKNKYDSDIADCEIRNDDSTELQRCIENAKIEYD